MTHPGPTTFGEDRHLNTWKEYGNKQANKQTDVTGIRILYERLFKLFTLFYILMRIQIYDFILKRCFNLVKTLPIIPVNKKIRPAKSLYVIRKSNMFDSHYTILNAPIHAYTNFSNSVLLCDLVEGNHNV